MNFEFATAGRILFGWGKSAQTGTAARDCGQRALLVAPRLPERYAPILDSLQSSGLEIEIFTVAGEPTVEVVRQGAAVARRGAQVVVGFGGGSAIDAAKAIAALAANPGDVLDYLEVIGQGRALENPPLPCIAVPTTAGTGAEVTRNAVIGSPEHRVKASLRHPLMLPKLAIIDPELTLSMPPEVTAWTGMDALTQLIEPFVSARANPVTDLFCREGIRLTAANLERAFTDGRDRPAREAMSYAALLGGMALANAGLGVVHGFAGPIGGMFDAPHGAVCAALLPHGMRANIEAVRSRAPGHPALERYADAARLLTGNADAQPEDGVEWVSRLAGRLRIPALEEWGISPENMAVIVERAALASSMKANPLVLSSAELIRVVDAARVKA